AVQKRALEIEGRIRSRPEPNPPHMPDGSHPVNFMEIFRPIYFRLRPALAFVRALTFLGRFYYIKKKRIFADLISRYKVVHLQAEFEGGFAAPGDASEAV